MPRSSWAATAAAAGSPGRSRGPWPWGWARRARGPASAPGAAGAAFAFDAAGARNARLVVAHAWSDATIDEAGWTLLQWDEIEAEQLGILDAQLAGWSEKYPDVEVTRIVEHENAARMLIGRSATAQLVVVGSRGRGAVRGALLGSVGQAVLRHADCPVAVVRP